MLLPRLDAIRAKGPKRLPMLDALLFAGDTVTGGLTYLAHMAVYN